MISNNLKYCCMHIDNNSLDALSTSYLHLIFTISLMHYMRLLLNLVLIPPVIGLWITSHSLSLLVY